MVVTWLTSCHQHVESPGYAGWFDSRTLVHTPVLYRGTISRNSSILAHTNYHPVLKTAAVKIAGCTLSPHDPHKYSSAGPKTRPPHAATPTQKTLCLIPSVQLTDSPVSLASSSILPPGMNASSSFPWFSCGWSAPLPLCNLLRPSTGFRGP